MPSVLFVGHRQIVQTQIRRPPLFACIIFYWNLNKNEKYSLTSLTTEMDCSNWKRCEIPFGINAVLIKWTNSEFNTFYQWNIHKKSVSVTMSIFSCQAAVKKSRVTLLLSIFICLSALKKLNVNLSWAHHCLTSRSVTTSASWFQPIRGGLI